LYGHAIKGMDDNLPFQRIFIFFKRFVQGGISISNRHLLILDGHESHVTLKAIEYARQFGLDMVILFLHTFHTLQPLDMAWFKPFKTNFRKKRNIEMVTRNHIEPNKMTFVGWVNKALNPTLTRK
jgi:hypothetical protein